MIYIKFLVSQFKILLMLLFSGVFVYPFIVYPKRRFLWSIRNLEKNDMPWYFWYADTYESGFENDERNYLNSIYGIYELVLNRRGTQTTINLKLTANLKSLFYLIGGQY